MTFVSVAKRKPPFGALQPFAVQLSIVSVAGEKIRIAPPLVVAEHDVKDTDVSFTVPSSVAKTPPKGAEHDVAVALDTVNDVVPAFRQQTPPWLVAEHDSNVALLLIVTVPISV